MPSCTQAHRIRGAVVNYRVRLPITLNTLVLHKPAMDLLCTQRLKGWTLPQLYRMGDMLAWSNGRVCPYSVRPFKSPIRIETHKAASRRMPKQKHTRKRRMRAMRKRRARAHSSW